VLPASADPEISLKYPDIHEVPALADTLRIGKAREIDGEWPAVILKSEYVL